MSRQFLRRQHDSTRFAARKRFLATVEQLERRDVLATTSPIAAFLVPSTAVVPAACDCSCTCSTQTGSTDFSDGTFQLPAFESTLGEAGSFLPAFSSRSLRDVIISTDLIVNTSPPADMVSAETTFNSSTGPEIFFDTSGLSPSNTFRISDGVDISSLSPGRYPFTMDFTEYISGTPTATSNQSGYVLVGSDSNALLSPGWYLPGLDRLSVSGSGALWETGEGEMYWFTDAGASYTANDGNDNFRTLVENGGSTFTLSNRFGEEIDFSSLGLVTEKRDRFGNVLFAYSYIDADSDSVANDIDEIETRDGRILSFGYTASQITSITDFEGRTVELAYDGSDRLESVTYPDPDDTGPLDPLVIAYTYLTGTSFPETVDQGGNVTTYAYGFADDVISRENQDGQSEEFEALLVQSLVDPGSGEGTFLNPASARLISGLGGTKEDALGNVTTTVFGPFGNPTKITDALGNQTILAYNSNGQITSRQDPDPDGAGSLSSPSTGFTYSSLNLTELSFPNGGTREWTYDSTWNVPDSYENELGLLTLYEINSGTGLVDSMRQIIGENDETSSETDDIVTDFTYTGTPGSSSDPPQGLLASITDGEGNITVFSHNARGDVTSVTYAEGTADEATVNIHYGALGLPDYIDDELGRRTTFNRDDLGRLTTLTRPDPDGKGPLTSPEYQWFYDERNNVIQVTDPLGRDTFTTMDERDRASKIELPDHDGDKSLTTFLRDYYETGELKTTTDPLGNEILRGYDKTRQLTSITLPEVADPSTAVNEVQVIDFDSGTEGTFKLNGNSKSGTIDLADTSDFQTVLDSMWGAGSTKVAVTSTEATVTFMGAQAATNVTQMTISDITGTKGATPAVSTSQQGDAADMVNPVLEFVRDNLGREIDSIDALGNHTQTGYSDDQLTITVTLEDPDGKGALKAPVFTRKLDYAGNVVAETDANENTTTRTFDALGRLTKVTTADPDAGGPLTAASVSHRYDKASNLIETTDAAGNVYGFEFDARNRKTQDLFPDPDGKGPLSASSISYEWNDANELTKVTDQLGRVTTLTRDDLGRVITVTLPDPDGKGSESSPELKTAYDAADRVITNTDANDNVTEREYDLLDNLVKITGADPDGKGSQTSPVSQWKFNAASWLIESTDADGSVTTFDHDNLGRVTVTTMEDPDGAGPLAAPVMRNQWDLNGNLVGVVDPLYHLTKYGIDPLNRRTSVEDALVPLAITLSA